MCTQAYFCRFSLGMKPRMGNPKDYVHRRSSHSSNIVGLATSHQRRRSQPTFCQSIIVYKYLSARTNNKLVSIRQDIDSGHHYQIISPQASERSRLRTISLPLALSLSPRSRKYISLPSRCRIPTPQELRHLSLRLRYQILMLQQTRVSQTLRWPNSHSLLNSATSSMKTARPQVYQATAAHAQRSGVQISHQHHGRQPHHPRRD